jgi:hypothetical protein
MKILKRCILIAAAITLSAMALASCLHGGKMMSITVTPATSIIAQGSAQQFTATATLSDGQTVNWTEAATWSSSDPTVATISNTAPSNGLATAGTPTVNTTTITATDPINNISSSTAQLTVYTPPITVAPTNQTISLGPPLQFTASALLSDGTTTQDLTTVVTWNSSDTSVATIDTTGLATPVSAGTTTITATDLVSSVTGTAVLTVQ